MKSFNAKTFPIKSDKLMTAELQLEIKAYTRDYELGSKLLATLFSHRSGAVGDCATWRTPWSSPSI
jgi:hypothetical protein